MSLVFGPFRCGPPPEWGVAAASHRQNPMNTTQAMLPPQTLPRLQWALACSGAGTLLFQAIWFRQLGWALGNTVMAGAATLAAFMLGLALGAGLAIRLTRRVRRPVQVYVIAEALVAITGVGTALWLAGYWPVIAAWLGPLLDQPVFLQSARFWLAVALLTLPAVAMGIGLPLLTCLWNQQPQLGPVLGRLYAANTAGAMLGLAAAELLLVPLLGLGVSLAIAAALLCGSALLALPLRRLVEPAPETHPTRTTPQSAPQLNPPPPHRWPFWLIAAGIGAIMLAIEVTGFRLLSLQIAGTSRDLALAIVIVLIGLALGSRLAAGWTQRHPQASEWIGLVIAAAAAGWVAGVALASLGATLAHPLARWAVSVPGLLLPVSICSGALMTLLADRLRREGLISGIASSQLLAANAAGAALGAALTGSWLLPGHGPATLAVAIVIAFVVLSLFAAVASHRRVLWLAPALALLVAAAGIRSLPALVDQQVALAAQPFVQADRASRVSVAHGRNETLQLLRSDFLDQASTWRLVTGRYSMSSTARDSERYMALFAWWGLALQPDPARALLISYGLGTTARSLLADPRVEQLDVVDISPETFDLAADIHTLDPMDDPRTRAHVTDGRFYLAAKQTTYDLITGEPPPPKMASIVNLYTREYFEQMRQRLSETGVATYWLPVDQLSPRSAKSIAGAFCAVFEHCVLAAGSHYNWILIGPPAAPQPDLSPWERRASLYLLRRAGVESPAMLWTGFLADADQLRAWIGEVPPLTDQRPGRLQLRAPTAQELLDYADWAAPSVARQRFFESQWVDRALNAEQQQSVAELWDWQPILNGFVHDAPIALIDGLLDTDLITPVLWGLGSGWNEQRIAGNRDLAPESEQLQAQQAFHRGVGHLARREPARAKQQFVLALEADWPRARELAVYAACRAGETDAARDIAGPARYAFRCW